MHRIFLKLKIKNALKTSSETFGSVCLLMITSKICHPTYDFICCAATKLKTLFPEKLKKDKKNACCSQKSTKIFDFFLKTEKNVDNCRILL